MVGISSNLKFFLPMVALIAAINAALIGFASFYVKASHDDAIQKAFSSTSNIAGALSHTISSNIEKGYIGIRSVAQEAEGQLAMGGVRKGKIESYIKRLLVDLPFLQSIRVTDANGDVLYGIEPGTRASAAGRDYFIRLRGDPSLKFVVSNPVVGHINRQWTIFITCRYNRPDGSFAGVVLSGIPLENLERLFSTVNLGKDGLISLRGPDLGLILRHPEPRGIGAEIGQAGVSPQFREIFESGKIEASYVAKTDSDGIERVISYRRIPAYPLHMIVGVPTKALMVGWRNELYVSIALVCATAFLSGFAVWLSARYNRREMTAAAALRESAALLRQSQEVAALGHYVYEVAARTWRCSEALDAIFGIPERYPKTVDGWVDIVHPDQRKEMLEYFRDYVIRDGLPFDKEYRIRRVSDGAERWVHGLGKLEFGEGAAPVRMFGTIQDITEQKRAEAEKERLQAQLQQAMKMEAVGRLAGGVAHDFNNLLTVIIGNVSMALAKVTPSEPVAGMLSEANRAAERAARLTQQLLAFSRRQIIEPKVLDLNALIVDLHTMLVRMIGENIELTTVTDEGLGAVKVDPGQFEQILMNLAVNARDAMPDGGRLTIETSNVDLDNSYCAGHPDATPGRFVLLEVSDTGQGMTDEVKARIFEPFFTTKEKGSGTGLGLSMTHGAVKQAGGSIAVSSEVGKGTTVRIYLPRVEGEGSTSVESAPPEELPEGTETVLLVEDEEVVRNLCVRVLEQLGYKVLKASCGSEAIALAQGYGERIDLLLTDVVMPGMNGSELASQLVPHHPQMQVLFTSGYTEDAIVHHGVLDEGVNFIGKPYTPPALAKKIREVLDKA